MSERLSREASALVDAVRAAEDPTDEDEARVLRALTASVAAGIPCHWQRYPLREEAVRGDAAQGDVAQGDATQGDAAAPPPAAELGQAGGALAKAGWLAWGAPLSALALCAAAWLVAGGGAPAVQHPASQTPRAAPAATPDPPHAGPAHDEQPALPGAVAPADAGAPAVPDPRAAAGPSRPRRGVRASAQRPEPSGLAAELALLQRAQAALRRGDGAGALRQLEALPESGGQLLGERRVARVLALCSLGRVAEAQALAADVLRSEPDSVQRGALERSCANPSRNRQR